MFVLFAFSLYTLVFSISTPFPSPSHAALIGAPVSPQHISPSSAIVVWTPFHWTEMACSKAVPNLVQIIPRIQFTEHPPNPLTPLQPLLQPVSSHIYSFYLLQPPPKQSVSSLTGLISLPLVCKDSKSYIFFPTVLPSLWLPTPYPLFSHPTPLLPPYSVLSSYDL